jgi:hypothetical protein
MRRAPANLQPPAPRPLRPMLEGLESRVVSDKDTKPIELDDEAALAAAAPPPRTSESLAAELRELAPALDLDRALRSWYDRGDGSSPYLLFPKRGGVQWRVEAMAEDLGTPELPALFDEYVAAWTLELAVAGQLEAAARRDAEERARAEREAEAARRTAEAARREAEQKATWEAGRAEREAEAAREDAKRDAEREAERARLAAWEAEAEAALAALAEPALLLLSSPGRDAIDDWPVLAITATAWRAGIGEVDLPATLARLPLRDQSTGQVAARLGISELEAFNFLDGRTARLFDPARWLRAGGSPKGAATADANADGDARASVLDPAEEYDHAGLGALWGVRPRRAHGIASELVKAGALTQREVPAEGHGGRPRKMYRKPAS